MRTFNLNLLNLAGTVIGFQTLRWYSFAGRTQNGRGQWVNTYTDKGDITGSWQPLSLDTVKELGLDVTKEYHNYYSSNPINLFSRNEAPDYLVISGKKHEVVGGASEWYEQNGWRGIVCVDVGSA